MCLKVQIKGFFIIIFKTLKKMDEMNQDQKDEAQREKIAEEKAALFRQLLFYIFLSALFAVGFYFLTLFQNPHLSNDFEIPLITDGTLENLPDALTP